MNAAAFVLASTCVLVPTLRVLDTPGSYRTDRSPACVEFFFGEAEAGNLRVVPGPARQPFKDGLPRAQDATSFAWLNAHQIIFSSSPIYGEGGLWRYDLNTKQIEEIGPIEKPSELEFLWTKLISVSATSITLELHSSGPICPNCTQTGSLRISMKGPKPDPSGQAANLFFACSRCGTTMRDRRRPGADRREVPGRGPGRR